MKKRVFPVLMSVAILVLAIVSPALAGEPAHETLEYREAFDVDCSVYGFDYTVRFDDLVTNRIITLYNSDGSVNRQEITWSLHGTVTNLDTGTVFRDQGAGSVIVYPTGQVIETGVGIHLQLPGSGLLVLRVGRAIFDPFPHVIFDAGQNRADDWHVHVCEALAGI